MSGIEIVGIAASVLQIADLGGRLSVKLFTFAKSVRSAQTQIDFISRDIAATGAVLLQLGHELGKDDSIKVCSKDAIETAQNLVEECNGLFTELNAAIDGGKPTRTRSQGSASNFIDALKRKAKWPFLEPHVDLLKANLERLKSSLMLILNVMIFAEQLRNHEALPLLKSQKELLQQLLDEKRGAEDKFQQAVKSIEGVKNLQTADVPDTDAQTLRQHNDELLDITTPVKRSSPLASPQSNETSDKDIHDVALQSSTATMIMKEVRTAPQAYAAAREEPLVPRSRSRSPMRYHLPSCARPSSPRNRLSFILERWDIERDKELFELYHDQYLSHLRLTHKLAAEISSADYTLSHRCRASLDSAIIAAYWDYSERYMYLSNVYKEGELRENLGREEDGKELVKFYSKLLHLKGLLGNRPSRSSSPEMLTPGRMVAGIERRLDEAELPDSTAQANDLSRPTWIRIDRRYVHPDTLEHFKLPWMWDENDSEYVIVKNFIDQESQPAIEAIFDHSRNLLSENKLVTGDPVPVASLDDGEDSFVTLLNMLQQRPSPSQLQPLLSRVLALIQSTEDQDFEGHGKLIGWGEALRQIDWSKELSDQQASLFRSDVGQAQEEFIALWEGFATPTRKPNDASIVYEPRHVLDAVTQSVPELEQVGSRWTSIAPDRYTRGYSQGRQPINEAVNSAFNAAPAANTPIPPEVLAQITSQITANVIQQLKTTSISAPAPSQTSATSMPQYDTVPSGAGLRPPYRPFVCAPPSLQQYERSHRDKIPARRGLSPIMSTASYEEETTTVEGPRASKLHTFSLSGRSSDLDCGKGNKELDELLLQYSTLTKAEVDDFNSRIGQTS